MEIKPGGLTEISNLAAEFKLEKGDNPTIAERFEYIECYSAYVATHRVVSDARSVVEDLSMGARMSVDGIIAPVSDASKRVADSLNKLATKAEEADQELTRKTRHLWRR